MRVCLRSLRLFTIIAIQLSLLLLRSLFLVSSNPRLCSRPASLTACCSDLPCPCNRQLLLLQLFLAGKLDPLIAHSSPSTALSDFFPSTARATSVCSGRSLPLQPFLSAGRPYQISAALPAFHRPLAQQHKSFRCRFLLPSHRPRVPQQPAVAVVAEAALGLAFYALTHQLSFFCVPEFIVSCAAFDLLAGFFPLLALPGPFGLLPPLDLDLTRILFGKQI